MTFADLARRGHCFDKRVLIKENETSTVSVLAR
jgi:hypothetical protein